jgi:hypothetical protein
MESDEWSVSKIKAEGRTVCLFELGGKLDAAGALRNATAAAHSSAALAATPAASWSSPFNRERDCASRQGS